MAMLIFNKSLPRRTFLRGVGATLALPFLDAMMPVFGATGSGIRPKRLGFVSVPNGIIMEEWTPATEGTGPAYPRVLQPLEKFRDRLLILSGLDQKEAGKWEGEVGGGHPRACTSFLTGAHAKMTSGADVQAGISVDQVAARQFGRETQLASLEIGLDSPEVVGSCESAYACAYYNTISWRNETTPNPMENRPRIVFERLFGDSGISDPNVRRARLRDKSSILDSVSMEVARLRKQVSHSDSGKIEQYVEAIRDVERRVQLTESQPERELPNMDGVLGLPEKFSDHYKLMVDLQVMALQSDLTRVWTLQIGHEMSNRAYPELGLGDAHHSVTHHSGDPVKIEKTTKVNEFHTTLFAYYLEKMQSTADGEGSLLDHSLMLYGSPLSNGNLHLFTDLPLLLVGGGVAGIKGDVHIRYPAGTPMNNLFLTMLDKAGVQVDRLGDSTGRLVLPSV